MLLENADRRLWGHRKSCPRKKRYEAGSLELVLDLKGINKRISPGERLIEIYLCYCCNYFHLGSGNKIKE